MIKDSLIDSILNGKSIREALAMFSESADSRIKTAEAIHTGGGIWLFYGELTNGNYFIVNDDGAVSFMDADVSDLDVSTDPDWYDEHLILELSGTQRSSFCNQLIVYLSKPENKDRLNGMSSAELEYYANEFNMEV